MLKQGEPIDPKHVLRLDEDKPVPTILGDLVETYVEMAHGYQGEITKQGRKHTDPAHHWLMWAIVRMAESGKRPLAAALTMVFDMDIENRTHEALIALAAAMNQPELFDPEFLTNDVNESEAANG